MTTYTMADLERVLKWRRRGLVIALAVVAIVLVAALGGQGVALLARCVHEGPPAGASGDVSVMPVDVSIARFDGVVEARLAVATRTAAIVAREDAIKSLRPGHGSGRT
jgi:hypothetical protein